MDNKQFTILDVLNILSFYIGLKNLEENLSQGQAGDMLELAVNDIHKHLQKQDEKIDSILEVINNDKNKKVSRPD